MLLYGYWVLFGFSLSVRSAQLLRMRLESSCHRHPLHLLTPPPRYSLPLGIYPTQILAPSFHIQTVSVKSVKQCINESFSSFLLVQSLLLRGIFVLPISRVCTCYTFWMSALSYPSSSNSSPRPLFPTATATGAGKSLYVCMCVRALKCMKQVLSRSLLRS